MGTCFTVILMIFQAANLSTLALKNTRAEVVEASGPLRIGF